MTSVTDPDRAPHEGPHGATQLWQAIAELGQLLLSEPNPRAMLQRVAVLAASTVDVIDEVGITTPGSDRPLTDAATSGLVFEVDNFQYDLGEGPCLHALETGEIVEVPSMRAEPRWSIYCTFAADHGLNRSLSVPLEAMGERLGVANLYSRGEGPFTERQRWEGSMFAMQAASALANQRAYEASRRLNEQLQEALSARSSIDQAKGILMERHGCDADAAFARLKQESQTSNRKLQVIAAEIVSSAGQGAEGLRSGLRPGRR
jgi:GAF domain-containing protein